MEEENRNINLKDKYKEILERGKEVRKYVSKRNDRAEPSVSECLAYDMFYIEKYVNSLLNRIQELEQIEKEHQKENGELREKVKELEEAISKEHTLGYSQGIYDCSEAWKETIKEKIEVRKQSINDIEDNFIIDEGMLGEIKRLEDEITTLQDLLEENK